MIVEDMPIGQYHDHPALSATGIKLLAKSPAHYYGKYLHPNRPRSDDGTAAMRAGTLAHSVLLESHKVHERYVVRPEGMSFATKDGKAWRDAQPPGVEIVSGAEMFAAQMQAGKIMGIPELQNLLSSGVAEHSVFAKDPITGVELKCRPDFAAETDAGVVLFDLKTCEDASPRWFGTASRRYGYDLQEAFYRRVYEGATGKKVVGMIFGAVESSWPHVAAAYTIPEDVLDEARQKCDELIGVFAACRMSGKWPSYADGLTEMIWPSYGRATNGVNND